MFAIILAVLLIGFCWAFGHLALLATSAVLVLDSLATAFRWIGVTDPAMGWLLLGVLGGAMIGAFVGLRRAGRPVTGRAFARVSTVVGAALLVAGNRLPTHATRTTEHPTTDEPTVTRPASAATRHMYVATEHASLRAWPGAGATIVGQLPGRARLDVFRASSDGAWWYVQGRRGASTVTGWVRRTALADAAPVTSSDEAVPPSSDVAEQRARADTLGGEVAFPEATARRGATTMARPRTDSGPGETNDRGIVSDIQARLADARAGASAGDYAASLRALAAADESAAIAGAKYGDPGWLAALRRETLAVRASTLASCQAASAQAVSRGETPPRCE